PQGSGVGFHRGTLSPRRAPQHLAKIFCSTFCRAAEANFASGGHFATCRFPRVFSQWDREKNCREQAGFTPIDLGCRVRSAQPRGCTGGSGTSHSGDVVWPSADRASARRAGVEEGWQESVQVLTPKTSP